MVIAKRQATQPGACQARAGKRREMPRASAPIWRTPESELQFALNRLYIAQTPRNTELRVGDLVAVIWLSHLMYEAQRVVRHKPYPFNIFRSERPSLY